MKSLISGMIGATMLLAVVQVASANNVEDQIASRIKPVGNVCVQGQPCAKDTASGGQQSASSGSGNGGEATFNKVCSACHKTGAAGAPKFGSWKDWGPRIAQGEDTLYKHAIHGFKAMPPKGTCMSCSDDQIKAAVDYMVDAAKKNKK